MSRTWIVTALVCALSSPLFAQEPKPCVDVVLIVDESTNIWVDYIAWLGSTVAALQSDYQATGVGNSSSCPNRYILVGFGSFAEGHGNDQRAHIHGTWMDAGSMVANLQTLVQWGDTEDGYEAIKTALTTLTFRKGAFRAVILLTNEDRYVFDPVTREDILKLLGGKDPSLQSKDAALSGVLDANFKADGLCDVLGVKWDGTAYIPAGGDKYYIVPGGSFVSGDGTTRVDYVELCWQDRGSAWNVNQIWTHGAALTNALTDVKVAELKPAVETESATPGATRTYLMGHCLHDGGQLCTFWFEYRKASSLSWKKSAEWFPTFTDDWFSDEIKGLTPSTNYVFRAWIKNSIMSAVGETWTFRTLNQ